MGPQSTQRLDAMGVKKTSQLIRIAQQLDADQWKRMFGGKRDSCEHSVWPTRYADVQNFLKRLVDSNRRNQAELRSRLDAFRAGGNAGGRTTDAWAVFADTRALPEEIIPRLQKDEAGGSYGWPAGMMGPTTSCSLHDLGITRTSQLIQEALSMDHDDFRIKFGSAFPKRYAGAHLFLVRSVTSNPENRDEYLRRLRSAPQPPANPFLPPRGTTQQQRPQPLANPTQPPRAFQAWLRRYSIPEDAAVAFIIFVTALLARALASDPIKSSLASVLILSLGFHFVIGQKLAVCGCLALYTEIARIFIDLLAGSSIAYLAFLACVYVCCAHYTKIPPSFIPALLRNH
jgi:hypothetical protein